MHWFLASAALWVAADAAMAPVGEARRYVLDEASSRITAKIPLLGVAGTTIAFPKMQGVVLVASEGDVSLDVTVDARGLTANDSMMQAEVRGPRFFDVAHFPNLHFVGRAYTPKTAQTGDLAGDLTIKGVTRPTILHVTFAGPPLRQPANAPLELTAQTTINRRDFNMTALPVVVGRKVAITIRARLLPSS